MTQGQDDIILQFFEHSDLLQKFRTLRSPAMYFDQPEFTVIEQGTALRPSKGPALAINS